MTQEKFEKAMKLQEQIAELTREIDGSYLPDGFRYIDAEIVYRVKNNSGDNVKFQISIPTEVIEATIHEVRDFHIEKKCELEKQFKEL
jgi:hypothetical protein